MLISTILTVLFVVNFFKIKNKSHNVLALFLIAVYCISFASSIYLSFIEENKILLLPSVFFISCIWLYINPFKNLKIDINYYKEDENKLKFLGSVFNVILVPAFIFFTYHAVNLFRFGNLATVRLDPSFVPFPKIVLTPIFTNFSALFFFPLFLFFYSFVSNTFRNQRLYYLISSLSFVALTFCYAGRDGFVYWIFNFIVLYFLFCKYIDKHNKKKIRRVFIIFGVTLSCIFIIITIFRFIEGGYSNDLLTPIIEYMGQQLGNFSESFDFRVFSQTIFPGIKYKLLGFERVDSTFFLEQNGMFEQSRSFAFFLRSLLWFYGIFGTLILSIVYYLLCSSFKKKCKSVFIFLILLMFYQIPLQGVFYYRQSIGDMDLPYLMFFLLCFSLIRKKQSSQKNMSIK